MDLSYLHILDPVRGALGQAVILMITAIYQNVIEFGDRDAYPKDMSYKILKHYDIPAYDFVIVGSSTAGCILTNRLAETGEFTVLLVEAGSYPSPTSDVPFLYFTLENTDEDWQFLTAEEKFGCKGFQNEQCMVSRGKVLGGTTTINNMHYHRGTAYDFDRWDLEEWRASVASPYFANLERYVGKTETPFDVGTKGNLTLSYFKSDHFLRLPLSKMYKTAGYKPLSRGKSLGYRDMLVNSLKSVRMNMARTFLSPIKNRPNLHLALGTVVSRVHFSDDNRAKGVDLMIGKYKKYVRVRKEIILTGGAINNVKLLHLSGIGPKELLNEYNIPVVSDLPVGQNLQMHFRVPLFVAIDKCCGQCLNCTTHDCQNDFFNYQDFYQNTWDYVMDKMGYFSNIGINDFVAYLSTNQRRRETPNVGVFHTYFKRNDLYLRLYLENKRYDSLIIDSILRYNKGRNIMIFYPTLLTPNSRGEVFINSTNFNSNPIIKPNFLSDETGSDYRSIYSAVTMIVSLVDSVAMQRYKAEFLSVDIPNCRNFKFCSEHYFRCYIKNLGCPPRTFCGTCKMGKAEESTSVVDPDLYVKNIENMRIADHSAVAKLGGPSRTSTDAFLGERVGDLIRAKFSEDTIRESYRKPNKRD